MSRAPYGIVSENGYSLTGSSPTPVRQLPFLLFEESGFNALVDRAGEEAVASDPVQEGRHAEGDPP